MNNFPEGFTQEKIDEIEEFQRREQQSLHVNTYRKKPISIEAIQWNGSNSHEIESFIGRELWYGDQHSKILAIETLEGTMTALIGDWIICECEGEFYPCKNSIFRKTYEPYDREQCKEKKDNVISDILSDVYNEGYEDADRGGNWKECWLLTMENITKRLIKLLPERRYTVGKTDKYTADYCEGFNKALDIVEKMMY